MFKNIGSKIKTLAKPFCLLDIFICVIVGIVLIVKNEKMIVLGFIIIIFGSLFSLISSFMIYGFGQLVENSEILVSKNTNPQQNTANNIDSNNITIYQRFSDICEKMTSNEHHTVCNKELLDKINTLDKWKKDGLITEKEYQQKMEDFNNG